jgi:hypothetical protein
MAGNTPYLGQNGAPTPTFEVSVSVTGGQLVEFDGTTQKIKPCTAGSGKCLGVALADGRPAGSGSNLDFSTLRPRVAVGRWVVDFVTYSADTVAGAKLVATANGQVGPAGATPDATTIVGQCFEPGGVLAGAFARAWIF